MTSRSLPPTSFARSCWRMLAIPLAIVLALSGYAGYTIYHANFHAIVKGEAYRSAQMTPAQFGKVIDQYGIKSILNLRGAHPTEAWYQGELQIAASRDVVHYDRGLSAGRELTSEELDDLVALLRRAPKPILIHCQWGADRTGLAAALYELSIAGQTPDKAVQELSIRYGHVPFLRPRVLAMDRSFGRYVDDHRLLRN